MTLRGRPVRFVAAVVGGWTAMRLLLPFPAASVPEKTPVMAGVRHQAARTAEAVGIPAPVPFSAKVRFAPAKATVIAHAEVIPIHRPATLTPVAIEANAPDAPTAPPPTRLVNASPSGTGLSATERGLPLQASPDRWSGSAWALWRRDDAAQFALGPRLGASQAGVRIDYALAPASPLRPALYARASSALEGDAAAEVAAGVAVRAPLPLPVTLAVERRQRVSQGGRSAFAILAAGGIYPVAIGHGFRLDAYAQAGMVGLRSRDAFADGRVTVERPVAAVPDLAIGAAVWGGVQPGVSRLDIGPQLSVRLPIADRTVRLGAEWRQKVAGNATPSSGPALSLGTDF